MTQHTRILLADDHEMIRQGLRGLLQAVPGMEVVGEAADGHTAVKLAGELSPDVVVMDINMPDLNGIDATGQIRAGRTNGDGPKVIALSAHSERRMTSDMFKAGAAGYVVKRSAFQELLHAVRSVVANKLYISPDVAGPLLAGVIGSGNAPESGVPLSSREREVLQLIAEGKSTKQVALFLHVSIKTAETHRRNIMHKLDLESVAELTRYAIREGITSLEQ